MIILDIFGIYLYNTYNDYNALGRTINDCTDEESVHGGFR
jgi:hypothetical protein